jgi:hypothetical protein
VFGLKKKLKEMKAQTEISGFVRSIILETSADTMTCLKHLDQSIEIAVQTEKDRLEDQVENLTKRYL